MHINALYIKSGDFLHAYQNISVSQSLFGLIQLSPAYYFFGSLVKNTRANENASLIRCRLDKYLITKHFHLSKDLTQHFKVTTCLWSAINRLCLTKNSNYAIKTPLSSCKGQLSICLELHVNSVFSYIKSYSMFSMENRKRFVVAIGYYL